MQIGCLCACVRCIGLWPLPPVTRYGKHFILETGLLHGKLAISVCVEMQLVGIANDGATHFSALRAAHWPFGSKYEGVLVLYCVESSSSSMIQPRPRCRVRFGFFGVYREGGGEQTFVRSFNTYLRNPDLDHLIPE